MDGGNGVFGLTHTRKHILYHLHWLLYTKPQSSYVRGDE